MTRAAIAPGSAVPAPVRRRRRVLGLLLLALALVLALVASVAIGAKPVPLGDVWHALTAPTGSENDLIVNSLRIPRTILGLLVGLALGIGGALLQGHTRNPLADPGLLGVNQGAAFAVVLAIFTFGFTDLFTFVWFGFAGALLATVIVFAIGSAGTTGRGGPTPVTLALSGAAVSAFLYALSSALILLDAQSLETFRFWRSGSLAGRDPEIILQVLPFLLAGLVLALANAPGLNAVSLGEDVARSLGQRIWLTRALGIAAVTLLTGAAVAACGPIGFVGLIVPHLARAITGPDYRWLLPYAGLIGAVLVLASDVLGRVLARPGELQVGIMLALVGSPFFVVLVRRRKLVSL
ncbi:MULTISPECIES: iron ABC transporter permease [unclassified Crossiella]|uniref:FecCD family ABC transporter permease n=1 Tax=unclassified Crossiella TaxID=2620835 RepID=UPI001FFE9EC0|nr:MULTISPECIES: iron ABC transporter permease [unclassified Crossiella]MCK2237786.1 iron ABC transporter permease [Crossiella sp. S99.2]MCK2255072.1 iron ABC transporter permease [Crossiella sp. S99.1]